MQDDVELLRLFAETKSEIAFAELVQRHIKMVYAVSLRRVGGDAHLAHDVTQEVFTDLAGKARGLSQRECLAGWLFVAARFAAAKAVRRDQQRHSAWRKAAQMNEQESASTQEPNWTALRPVLDEAIHELNERDRTAVLLYFFDQQTYRDLGAKLLLTENGARMRVERALDKLRGALSRRGITSTSAALASALSGQAQAVVPAGLADSVAAASIAGAAQSSGALLLFMAITKTQLSVAIIAVVAGATIGGIAQHQQIVTLRDAVQASSVEVAATRELADEFAVKLSSAESEMAGLRTQLAARRASVASQPPTSRSDVTVIRTSDVVRDYPEYADLRKKERRRNALRQYHQGMIALNLPAEQLARLKELIVEKSMSLSDAQEAAKEAGFGPGRPETAKAMSEVAKVMDEAIVSLIGKESFEKLEALRGHGNHSNAQSHELDMWDAGVPLSAEQSQSLAFRLRSVVAPKNRPPGYYTVDPKTHLSPADYEFFKQAALMLSPTQLQILETTRREDNQRQAIIRHYRTDAPGSAVMLMD